MLQTIYHLQKTNKQNSHLRTPRLPIYATTKTHHIQKSKGVRRHFHKKEEFFSQKWVAQKPYVAQLCFKCFKKHFNL